MNILDLFKTLKNKISKKDNKNKNSNIKQQDKIQDIFNNVEVDIVDDYIYEHEQDISEFIDYNKGIIIYLRQEHLEKIVQYISPSKLDIISSNEWLFFSNALVSKSDNLFIVIPVSYYTIPAEVSLTSIDYSHVDILEFGKNIKKDVPKELLDLLYSYSDEITYVTGCISFHKHPSKSAFSGEFGDGSKSAKNPGILFRTQKATNTIICDFVFHQSEDNYINLSDVSSKLVNVKPHDIKFAIGEYTYMPTIVSIRKRNIFHEAFGFKLMDNIFDKYDFLIKNIDTYRYEVVRDLLEELDNIEYEPEYKIFDEHFIIKQREHNAITIGW